MYSALFYLRNYKCLFLIKIYNDKKIKRQILLKKILFIYRLKIIFAKC